MLRMPRRVLLPVAIAVVVVAGAWLLVAPLTVPAAAAEAPVIHGLNPPEAYYRAWVTISGAHFGTAAGTVTFAGPSGRLRAATRAWSDARIEAEVPYNARPGDVIVRTAGGQSSNGVHFSPPCWDKPVIRQIIPAAAMQCEVVKIIGCGFGDFQYEQVLTFNGVDATGTVIGLWSDTELLVPVPDEATSGPVVVTNKRRVPSAGFPLRVRDDTPEWDRLPGIGQSTHSLDVTLRVGETPEEGRPREIEVERKHWQRVGDAVRQDVVLTATWRTQQVFEQSAVDPAGGTYTIEGTVDRAAGTLRVKHRDAWSVESWHNGSTGERRVCHHELELSVEAPIGTDGWGRPAFNVWGPRWVFAADGADLGNRASGLAYRQACFIYDYAGRPVRRDGTYELLGADWESSRIVHVFDGGGSDPCREEKPKWAPVGQIHGRAYARTPLSLTSWTPDFTGFPSGSRTAPLAGVPVVLSVTPPGGARTELATTVTGDDGRYVFTQVPLTTTLDLEVTLEYRGVAPPGFHVTYRRADGAARTPVTLRTRPFSNVSDQLLSKDVVFTAGTGSSTVDPDDLDDVAVTYAHTWQAWQTAGDLGLELDMHVNKREPLEVRTFSPAKDTYWHGDANVGPNWGLLALPITDNVHINIAATDATSEHGDRPTNREWHETGHHVHADIQADSIPRYWVNAQLNDTNHDGRLNPTTVDSWIEGFAEFFSLLVARHAARDPHPGLYRTNGVTYNLDQNLTSFSVIGADPRADEELAVASLLWDLVDSAGDEADVRPMGVNQSMLDAWGVRLAHPLAPADVRWPPTLYGDRIALDDRVLMFLVSEADKIAATYGVTSTNSAAGYAWIFDVHQLYRTLATMGVGADVGASGLSALDELFVAHGFYADTAPQNLCYDRGEAIGKTSNATYTVTTTRGSTIVPAWADRRSPAPRPESFLRFDARDAATGAPVSVPAFEVAIDFDPPYDLYDYAYTTAPSEPGRLALVASDPVYPSTIRVSPRGERLSSDEPFEITSAAYWRAVVGGSGTDVFRHTFVVHREPSRIHLPLVLDNAVSLPAPQGQIPPPPTAPSSTAFAAELIALINAERERAGRTVVATQGDLTTAAAWYAGDMAASGDYRADHSDRQGRTMPQRLKALGYTSDGHPRWHVSENIARGQKTPKDVFAAWMASPPHRANILDRDACEIGVAHAPAPGGAYRHYWVADFGCRAAPATIPVVDQPGGTSVPGPSATPDGGRTTTPTRTVPTPTPTRTIPGPSPTMTGPGPSVTPGGPEPSVTPPGPSPTVSWPTPTPAVTLEADHGIQGRVTERGVPVEGVFLILVRISGEQHEELHMAQTWIDGTYAFASAPTLAAGQSYYVKFANDEQDPRRLAFWFGPDIPRYAEGEALHGGDFDIADVELLSPSGGMSMWLPAEFRWARRTFGPHRYRWVLTDRETGQRWTSGNLGDRGDFTLTTLPDGAAYDREYWWTVWVYLSPDCYGVASVSHPLMFMRSAE